MDEFSIIEKYFSRIGCPEKSIITGVGDDAAVLAVTGSYIAVCTDTLVENVHFLKNIPAELLGYRVLAVNLSDVAAMGGDPVAFTLALSISADQPESWFSDFSRGLHECAKQYQLQLIGGDTSKSDTLTVTVQALAYCNKNKLLRNQAKPGDHVFVSGFLGDAKAGLEHIKQGIDHQYLQSRFYKPTPRIELGKKLVSLANACIDISDGFAADLEHILKQSKCGARVNLEKLPVSEDLQHFIGDEKRAQQFAVNAGDDYELCFTVPADNTEEVLRISNELDCLLTQVGIIEEGNDLNLYLYEKKIQLLDKGYRHF